jgi:pimeloyl-ACP methyl ester carboxylesterase
MPRRNVSVWVLIVVALGCFFVSGYGVPEEPAVKRVRVNGIDLACVDLGRGEPVVLIHGFLHDYRVWAGQMESLARHYRVVAYSQRYRYPFAPAPEGADTILAADLEDLAGLIRSLKLGPVHVIGHSRGSNLAMLFTRKHPELVRSMILGEGPARRPAGEDPARIAASRLPHVAEARKAYERGDIEGAIRIFAEGVLGTEHLPERPSVREIPLANAWQLRTLGVPDSSVPPFTCEDARRIQAPTLFLRGELSRAGARANAETWQKCRPGAEHAVLQEASHGLQMQNPAGFNEIVLKFLMAQSHRGRP